MTLKGMTSECRINDNEFFCTDVEQGEYMLCKSAMFDFEGGCYARSLSVPGFMSVRLDLPDDHPARIAATEDIGPKYAEYMEVEDIVPITDLERPDGRPIRTWTRPLTSSERAERARRNGFTRLSLPELDASLGHWRSNET